MTEHVKDKQLIIELQLEIKLLKQEIKILKQKTETKQSFHTT